MSVQSLRPVPMKSSLFQLLIILEMECLPELIFENLELSHNISYFVFLSQQNIYIYKIGELY